MDPRTPHLPPRLTAPPPGVVPAYAAVRAAYPDLPVEVEVTDLDQLVELPDAGCERILLDNMDNATMTEAVRVTAGRACLEASGGLIHSVTVFDLGLDLP
jgi:nicotinate-nucleotide pyrophosphorylase (carboxylating)